MYEIRWGVYTFTDTHGSRCYHKILYVSVLIKCLLRHLLVVLSQPPYLMFAEWLVILWHWWEGGERTVYACRLARDRLSITAQGQSRGISGVTAPGRRVPGRGRRVTRPITTLAARAGPLHSVTHVGRPFN